MLLPLLVLCQLPDIPVVWQNNTDEIISPSQMEAGIVVANASPGLVAIDASSGKTLWGVRVWGTAVSSRIAEDGYVYGLGMLEPPQTSVFKVSPAGAIVWKRAADATTIQLVGERIVTHRTGRQECLRALDGETLWTSNHKTVRWNMIGGNLVAEGADGPERLDLNSGKIVKVDQFVEDPGFRLKPDGRVVSIASGRTLARLPLLADEYFLEHAELTPGRFAIVGMKNWSKKRWIRCFDEQGRLEWTFETEISEIDFVYLLQSGPNLFVKGAGMVTAIDWKSGRVLGQMKMDGLFDQGWVAGPDGSFIMAQGLKLAAYRPRR